MQVTQSELSEMLCDSSLLSENSDWIWALTASALVPTDFLFFKHHFDTFCKISILVTRGLLSMEPPSHLHGSKKLHMAMGYGWMFDFCIWICPQEKTGDTACDRDVTNVHVRQTYTKIWPNALHPNEFNVVHFNESAEVTCSQLDSADKRTLAQVWDCGTLVVPLCASWTPCMLHIRFVASFTLQLIDLEFSLLGTVDKLAGSWTWTGVLAPERVECARISHVDPCWCKRVERERPKTSS